VHVHHQHARAALNGFDGGWATGPLIEAALVRLLIGRLTADSPADAEADP
jgi:hypothetical protein